MSPPERHALFPLLLENARLHPARPAIITPDRRIDHGALPDHVQAIAGWLLEQGFNPDTMTGVTVTDEVDHLLITLALVCLGTPSISLGSFEGAQSHLRVAEKLQMRQYIAPQQMRLDYPVRRFWPPADCAPSNRARERMVSLALLPEDRLLYTSTSGTTGVPKTLGRTMVHTLYLVSLIVGDPGKHCILRTSSVEHDASRVQQVCTLLAGRTAAILHPVSADNLAPFCAQAGVTEVHGGTYRLASLLAGPANPAHRLPEAVRFVTGGSRVPGTLRAAALERLTKNLLVTFATSEIGTVSVAQPDEHVRWPDGVGHPRPDIDIELRDEKGQPVARGEVGALWVRKKGVPGTGTALNPHWVPTGDLLSWPEDGPLLFHSRTDDMMIMNGINIFPGPIEDTLSAHAAVAEVVAYPTTSAVHGQIPVAAVVLHSGATVSSAELLRHCREALGLRAPRQVQIVDSIPRTTLGKPRTLALRGIRATG